MTGGAGGTVVLVVAGGVGRGVDVIVGGGCGVGVAGGCFFTHAVAPANNETIRTVATRVIGVLKVIMTALSGPYWPPPGSGDQLG